MADTQSDNATGGFVESKPAGGAGKGLSDTGGAEFQQSKPKVGEEPQRSSFGSIREWQDAKSRWMRGESGTTAQAFAGSATRK